MMTATAGDIVVIPPGYGHISINPSPDETLAMANIVSTAFESEYGEYETLPRAAYYEMCSGEIAEKSAVPGRSAVRYLDAASGHAEHRILQGPLYSLIGNQDEPRVPQLPGGLSSRFLMYC